ncbi:hypothetical protein [Mesobacillus subterraneus]|uniref:Uncharacterized protein n=1 Tax=Mesobacillus subterraneus TaxID=285983 RepID=A0A427TQ49_9BACI|nr:hypothetical protein [Mesobacillus subterraneus]RSD26534.1 hypothetical protein EJA10_14135 [Mesobacillus subterraneus]
MKPGIEKEEMLRLLTKMAHSLDETDMNMHGSMQVQRVKMCQSHAFRLEELRVLVDRMEAKMPMAATSGKQETSALKLELSF